MLGWVLGQLRPLRDFSSSYYFIDTKTTCKHETSAPPASIGPTCVVCSAGVVYSEFADYLETRQ